MNRDQNHLRWAVVVLGAAVTMWASAGPLAARATDLPTWMSGCWTGHIGDEEVHERWVVGDPSTLLGVSHTLKSGALSAFEFLRVVVKGGAVVYIAQPGGAPPTEFTAASSTATEVTFENPAHDFPKRVGYRRIDATHLTAWIDGGAAAPASRHTFPMARDRCEP